MAEEKRQKKIFDDFTASLTPEVEKLWTTKILEWEKDSAKPNPYVAIVTRTCLFFVSAITPVSFFILRRFSGRSEEPAPSRGTCRGESGDPSATRHRPHCVCFTRFVGGRTSVSSIQIVCDIVTNRWYLGGESAGTPGTRSCLQQIKITRFSADGCSFCAN